MIIYNNKIDKALMNESDSKWDELIAIARNNGFILSSNADGTVTICKNETALKMLLNDKNTRDAAEEILISRNKNLYDLDLRLKEKVYVYLSDNQKRIKNAKIFKRRYTCCCSCHSGRCTNSNSGIKFYGLWSWTRNSVWD